MAEITISGTGCALADFLYSAIDFEGPAFSRYRSSSPGDGGLVPGALVFAEQVERFAGCPAEEAVREISGAGRPDVVNLGGPAIVALVACKQLLEGMPVRLRFAGASGDDEAGRFIRETIAKTGIHAEGSKVVPGRSPVTYVLSDSRAAGGHGERTFINRIAASGSFGPEDLPPGFFDADITLFGATALVPRLHEALGELLLRAKARGTLTVVSTVYDFASEHENPGGRWPLGRSDESYRDIDLLVADREEALHLSGTADIDAAADFFRRRGVGACIVTDGPNPVCFFSAGRRFANVRGSLPVSLEVSRRLAAGLRTGDTTGCGDNFVGGVLASIALQLLCGTEALDLPTACALGIACGGQACFYLGGTYAEATPGDKLAEVSELYESFRRQAHDLFPIERLALLRGERSGA